MPATFLELTNAILGRFNEVPLTSATFSSAGAAYVAYKESINAALNEIYTEQAEWPFLRIKASQTLVPYQTRYEFPDTYKVADIESFRLRHSTALSATGTHLNVISYDEYLQKFSAQEYTDNDTDIGVPRNVFYGASLEFGITPKPDKAYVVDYEYISQPLPLVLPGDACMIPDAYTYTILSGAEYYAHTFRDNLEAASRSEERFKKGIKDMRKVLINRNDYVRSTMLPHRGHARGFFY